MRSKALLLAAVVLATLALASPAVARPVVHSVTYAHTLSAAATITIACLAAIVAVALVTGAVVWSRPKQRVKVEETATEQFQAPRVKKVRQRQAAA